MVIYCKSVHFHGFEDARKNLSFYEMSSFKEGKATKLAMESGESRNPSYWLLQPKAHHQITIAIVWLVSSAANEYICHNAEKLSRIYPAGIRTDSSNYNPVPLWNAGCQIGTSQLSGAPIKGSERVKMPIYTFSQWR